MEGILDPWFWSSELISSVAKDSTLMDSSVQVDERREKKSVGWSALKLGKEVDTLHQSCNCTPENQSSVQIGLRVGTAKVQPSVRWPIPV
jgi:hypothetical protein